MEPSRLMIAACRLLHDGEHDAAAQLVNDAPDHSVLAATALVNLAQALAYYAEAAGVSFDVVLAAMGRKAAGEAP